MRVGDEELVACVYKPRPGLFYGGKRQLTAGDGWHSYLFETIQLLFGILPRLDKSSLAPSLCRLILFLWSGWMPIMNHRQSSSNDKRSLFLTFLMVFSFLSSNSFRCCLSCSSFDGAAVFFVAPWIKWSAFLLPLLAVMLLSVDADDDGAKL